MTQVIDKADFFKAINYTPHSAGQWSFHNCRARFRVPCCGRRFGKSLMVSRDEEPRLFVRGKFMDWIVGPTYDLGEKEFRVIWDDLIVKRGLGKRKDVRKAYNKRSGELYIEMPWGTRLEVRSAAHPETLVGESLRHVIMSEAAKHTRETWERYIRPALADLRGTADFPTTPEGYNWYYNLWQLGQNPQFPDYWSSRFPSWENRVVYPGGRNDPEILLIEQTSSAEWFLQEIAADFASFVGKIYPEFDETVHVRDVTYNPAWPNYVAFDFGYVNPLAAVEFQIDPFDNIYIWREYYKSYVNLDVAIREMQQRPQPPDYKIDLCFGDPADPEAVAVLNRDYAPTMAHPDCKTNWRAGIEVVKKFLRTYPVGELDEFGTPKCEPKLFVGRDCQNTIREFQSYRTRDNVNSKTNESSSNSAAVKIDDHTLDAIRYALMHLYVLGATYHLEDVVPPGGDAWYAEQTGYESGERGIFTMGSTF